MLALFDRQRGIFSYTLNRKERPAPVCPDRLADEQVSGNKLLSPALYTQNNRYVFVFGCLDNREELCKLIALDWSEQHLVNNAELLFRLFMNYKEETPGKLYGNWLYVIYDDLDKTLWLAQNQHEYAALFYYEDWERFSFSTSQDWLLSLDHVPRQLDLLKIVQREVVISHASVDKTFFKGIRLLNPAHWMWVTRTESHREQYWHPERISVNHRISHSEAVEQMLFLFKEAVNKRINRGSSVASMLSGGLDSGSVVTVAAELLQKQNRALHTYSHVLQFDLDGLDIGKRTGNEQPLMEATAGCHRNIVTHYLDSAHLTPLQGIREINRILLEPIHAACNAYWIVDIVAQAAANGHDLLLNGAMGNATISYTGCIDALSNRAVFQYLGLKRWIKQRILKPPYLLTKRGLNQFRQREGDWQTYSYLHPRLASALDLETMISQSGRPVDFSSWSITCHQEQIQNILKVGFNPRLRGTFTLARHMNLEVRDPTGDIKLIEFILSLPNEFYFGPMGEEKWMLKQTMKHRLPDKVLYQKFKGLQSADIQKRVQPDLNEIESIIRDFRCDLHEEPLFDTPRLLHELKRVRGGGGNYMMTHHLLRSVGIMEFLNIHG